MNCIYRYEYLRFIWSNILMMTLDNVRSIFFFFFYVSFHFRRALISACCLRARFRMRLLALRRELRTSFGFQLQQGSGKEKLLESPLSHLRSPVSSSPTRLMITCIHHAGFSKRGRQRYLPTCLFTICRFLSLSTDYLQVLRQRFNLEFCRGIALLANFVFSSFQYQLESHRSAVA